MRASAVILSCLIAAARPGLLSGGPPAADAERDRLLARAQDSVEAAARRVQGDPSRPVYHLLPPANWMNDPNGPLHYKGSYHLFYQHNPYGDAWGHMHWGHLRSQDLVHWQPLPIALWPAESKGEEHVFSGCAAFTDKGQPLLLYTSIGRRAPEQWAAVPADDQLLKWKKHPANPLLTEALHGKVKVHEWRDPFVFRHKGRTYVVCGGNLNGSKGGQAVVNVYRAENGDLTRWKYLGVLFRHPDAAVRNIECPLFFPLDGRWVLIVSQGRPVQYFVGDLDDRAMKFQPRARGVMDFGNYYAPNCLEDAKGRRVLWGWVLDFPPGKGWNGCLTLPRVLTVAQDNTLRQRPLPGLARLRGKGYAEKDVALGAETVLKGVRGPALEIVADLDLGGAAEAGLNLCRSDDGKKAVPVTFDGRRLRVAGLDVPLQFPAGEKALRLHVFLDHSVLEVYANGRACVTRVIQAAPEQQGVSLLARGDGARLRSLQCWPVGSIWEPARR
jgi:beta-fructofuranosidase